MAKKVLIISTSLRGGSNSDILANECAKGAKEAGHDVELLSLKGKDIKYCIGCLSCQKTGMCVLKDDVADIMAKVKDAEVIVYATPIYYYEMCGQMKTLLDRLNPLYSTDYSFRDIYMIATAAENDESAFEKAYNGLQGWVDCFEKASLKGMVGGGGIDAANIAASDVGVDTFGHKMLTGSGKYLENLVKDRLGVKVRSIELNVNQRCSSAMLSATDEKEAIASGSFGVQTALKGTTGMMIAFHRTDDADYHITYAPEDVNLICNQEKTVPLDWITGNGSDIGQQFIDYALPLIQGSVKVPEEGGLPKFAYRK